MSTTGLSMTTTAESATVRAIADVGLDDVLEVGGKGANLGELTRCGLPVPGGFVICASAFLRAIDATGRRDELVDQTARAPGMSGAEVSDFAVRARALVREAGVPDDIAGEIRAAFRAGGFDRVAVRSSATAEDASDT